MPVRNIIDVLVQSSSLKVRAELLKGGGGGLMMRMECALVGGWNLCEIVADVVAL